MSSDRSRGRIQPAWTQLEGIAEAARRAGVLIDAEGHDWEPDVMVRAHGGAWLISRWSSGSPRGWGAQQMVKVELDWLRIPGTRAWLAAADLEPDRIVRRLLEAVELPREPDGQPAISTRRVPDAEIRGRLTWLRSSGLRVAKAPQEDASVRAIASLATSLGSFAASSSKEVGAAGARVVVQGARRLRDQLRTREGGQSLRIVPQPGTPTLYNGVWRRPSRLDTRDGEGLLEWDDATKRWRFSSAQPESHAAQIPRIRVPPQNLSGSTESVPRALDSAAQD